MVGVAVKPERRLTKMRRSSTGRSLAASKSREAVNSPTSPTQEDLRSPKATDGGSLWSSSSTRLQLRHLSSSPFHDSDSSLARDVTSPVESEHRRSRFYAEHSERSTSRVDLAEHAEETQTIDVPAAIALLQELKKHATADELVALHKALLPTRRSVENMDNFLAQSEHGENRYASHRRSHVFPGLATRGGPGSDPLQTIEELAERRKSQQEPKKRQSVQLEIHHVVMDTQQPLREIHRSVVDTQQPSREIHHGVIYTQQPSREIQHGVVDTQQQSREIQHGVFDAQQPLRAEPVYQYASMTRPISPAPQNDLQAGVYRTGTLRITNRSPSPASTMQPSSGLDGTIDERSPTLTMTRVEATSMQRVDGGFHQLHTTTQAFSSSTMTLNAAMEEYTEFSTSPYDRHSLPRAPLDLVSQASSSCESFKTPVEAGVPQDFIRGFASLEKLTLEAYSSADENATHSAVDRPPLPHNGDSGYASEVSSERQSRSLEAKRKQDSFVAIPETPSAPVARIRSKSGPSARSEKHSASHLTTARSGSSENISALPPLHQPPQIPDFPQYPSPQSRSPREPPPEMAELLGLSPVNPKPQLKASKSSKSIKSSKSLKSQKSLHDQTIDPKVSQRIEDIFTAPGEQRPKNRRQTLLSSLGFGKKSDAGPKDAVLLDHDARYAKAKPQPQPQTQPLVERSNTTKERPSEMVTSHQSAKASKEQDNMKRNKSKKLKKTAPRHVKQARKELAKFEASNEPVISAPLSDVQREKEKEKEQEHADEDDSFDAQPDWFWQDDFSVPAIPSKVRTFQPHPPPPPPFPSMNNRARRQHHPLPVRQRRNLSVVQEVDHDSISEHGDEINYRFGLQAQQPEQTDPLRPFQAYRIPDITFDSGPGLEQTVPFEVRPIHSSHSDASFGRRATHRANPSIASSVSSLTSGQLELIEEVQSATIDWAVQAKFWKARRTLVGHGLQHQGQHDQDECPRLEELDEEEPVGLLDHNTDEYALDYSSKFRVVDLPSTGSSVADTSSFPRRQSSLIRHSLGQTNLAVLPRSVPDRYSGGLEYEWTRESGVIGSAGTGSASTVEIGRSAPSKEKYGLDLSDVPVFVTKR